MSNFVSIDFETFYSRKLKCSVSGNLPEEYVQHELFDTYMLSYCDGERAWSGHPSEFNWSALEGKVLLSHNRRFDNTVYNRLVEQKLAPKINFAGWHCTANLTSYLCNRRSLDASVEHLYKIKLDKSARANAEGKRWPNDFSEQERVNILRYAKDDALWCWRLWNDFSAQMPSVEQRLSDLTIEQGMRGVQINVELLHEYLNQSHEMLLETTKQIPWLEDDNSDDWDEFKLSPTSTKCICEMCRRVGIPAPPVKARDAEGFEEWEAAYAPAHPWIHAVSAWRSVNRLYKTLLLVKRRLTPENVLPFSLKYFGAHTGRWSGDARINFQNFRKVPIFCNEQGLMEASEKRCLNAMDEKDETGKFPSWVKYSIDFRALIIPRAGKKMVLSDLRQIEPRVLAWLAGNREFLDLVRQGISPYEAHARATMGYSIPTPLDQTDPVMYKLAKARVLGLGFGCGWAKFIKVAYTMARLDITVDDPEFMDATDPISGKKTQVSGYGKRSKEIVEEYRKQNPQIVALWKNLDESFKRSIGSEFTVTLPSGRKMRYEDVRASVSVEKDKETGKPKRVWKYTAMSDAVRKSFYGGKLCENVVQATARDVFAEHIIMLEDRGFTNLWSSHDEAICEIDADVTAKDIEEVMSTAPAWANGLPVAAEAREVPCYLK